LRTASLLKNHALNSLLNNHLSKKIKHHQLSLKNLTSKQQQKPKSFIVDSNNYLNGLFPSFNNLHKELLAGFHLVVNYHDCFSFHIMNYREKDINNTHICNYDRIFQDTLLDPKTVIIISNTSIKKNIATSVLHVYSGCNILAKTIHHAINVTSIEVELFAIRCSINQAVQVENVTNIIIIINTIHATRQIFNSSSHSYQLQSIAITQDLRIFFNKSSNNSIAF